MEDSSPCPTMNAMGQGKGLESLSNDTQKGCEGGSIVSPYSFGTAKFCRV